MSIADKLTIIAENEQKVYEAGKQAEHTVFWNSYQSNGNRTNYDQAFNGTYWNDTTYNPIYTIKAKSPNSTYNRVFLGSSITDTKVDIDASESSCANSMFQACRSLKTIRKLIVHETLVYLSSFTGCTALENLNIVGVIGRNISFVNSSLLTKESLYSIINALKDLSGTTNSYTLTIGTANLAKLTDSEKAMATEKGWTLA